MACGQGKSSISKCNSQSKTTGELRVLI
jgi:hypothetical protein